MRLAWDAAGERLYEVGVDRGVLYKTDGTGEAWNGMTAVSEAPSGGEIKEYYVDGIKYLVLAPGEEFAATLEAYTYPEAFGLYDGTVNIINGLSATQQRRRSFGLSYRTMIGNDVEGTAHGYKIHLVYNALAAPSPKNYTTQQDSTELTALSWSLVTKPARVVGLKPTAHFVIDSRSTPPSLLKQIEDILYGSQNAVARLPAAQEIVDLFVAWVPPLPPIPPILPNDGGGATQDPSANVTFYDGGSVDMPADSMFIDGGPP